jgi:NAD(P)-dependent dehydrogenase (short-subunit alcohol dehydrogenase family)
VESKPRSVVVTGCGAGIGRGILERLSADGWRVAGVEIDPVSAADAQRTLDARGGGRVIVGDAGDREVLAEARAAATDLAPLRGWVNNAAVVAMGTLHDADPEKVRALFKLNIEGYFWGCAEAVRTFMAQRSRGSIVSISSLHARVAFPNWVAYETSKAALGGLTRYIAVEYGRAGIRANTVEPGAIWTPWNEDHIARSSDPAATQATMESFSVLGRMGKASEIAAAVAFLLSDEASFITGSALPVEGGATARSYPFDPDPAVLPPLED